MIKLIQNLREIYGRTISSVLGEDHEQKAEKYKINQQMLIKELHEAIANYQTNIINKHDITSAEESLRIYNKELAQEKKKLQKYNDAGFNRLGINDRIRSLSRNINDKRDILHTMRSLYNARNYFRSAYPNAKFITLGELNRLSKKYGLVIHNTNRYIGNLPDEQLNKILKFKVKEEDRFYYYYDAWDGGATRQKYNHIPTMICNKDDVNKKPTSLTHTLIEDTSTFIMASVNDFDLSGMRLDKYNEPLIHEDPIVFKRVIYDGEIYALVIAAWGPEASEPSIVNEKLN